MRPSFATFGAPNEGHWGPDPLYAPQTFSIEFANIFAQLLADRYVVVPGKEAAQPAGGKRRKP